MDRIIPCLRSAVFLFNEYACLFFYWWCRLYPNTHVPQLYLLRILQVHTTYLLIWPPRTIDSGHDVVDLKAVSRLNIPYELRLSKYTWMSWKKIFLSFLIFEFRNFGRLITINWNPLMLLRISSLTAFCEWCCKCISIICSMLLIIIYAVNAMNMVSGLTASYYY